MADFIEIAKPGGHTAPLIDTHTHIDQHPAGEVSGIIARAKRNGVGAIVAAGVTAESSQRCTAIAGEFEAVFAAIGLHPQEIVHRTFEKELMSIQELLFHRRVVAMSEIGLDYQPNSPDKTVQQTVFVRQIRMAQSAGLAVVFHNREATEDTLRILRETNAGKSGGAAHYFQGSWDYACSLMDMGFHLSLAKPLVRLPELQSIAARLPLDRVVLETDSYPQPFKKNRSKWTEPKDTAVVASCLAQLKGLRVEEVCEAATRNTLAMLGERGQPIAAFLRI